MLKPVLSAQTSILLARNKAKASQRNVKQKVGLSIDTGLGDSHYKPPPRLFSPTSCTHTGRQKMNCHEGMAEAFLTTKNEIELEKLHKNDEEEC